MIIEHLLQGIEQADAGRQRGSPVRMSAAGKCQRAIGYQLRGEPTDPLPARSLMVFRLGDTVEAEVKALIQKYVPADYVVEYPKDAVVVDIDGHKIEGHVDGLIKHPLDAVLEIKSINAMRFKGLDTEGIPYDYKCQATMYMKALGLTKTVFIFYCKDTSHLKEMVYEYENWVWDAVRTRWLNVLGQKPHPGGVHVPSCDELPAREFVPDRKGQLPWQCRYCSYVKPCWPDAVTSFSKTGKPVLTTKETA